MPNQPTQKPIKQALKPLPQEIIDLLKKGLYIINSDGVITPADQPHVDSPDWEYDEHGNMINSITKEIL